MREGELVGGFRLLQRLGRGGMAEVWRAARPEAQSEQRALKVLPLEQSEDEGPRVRRFMDEAWIGMSLNHPNVVRVFDRGIENHHAYIVMELLTGCSLSDVSKGKPLPVGAVVDIARQALSGLIAMHEARSAEGQPLGLVHRDIKPSNLFLTLEGKVRIIDFGISHVAALDQTLTRTGTVRGSLPYCAPEQVRSETQTAQSDLFSLGLVLYELLQGERCFPQKTDATILSAILFSVIPPVHLSRTDVPRPVSEFIGQLLEKDPTARPISARAAAEALEKCSAGVEHWSSKTLAEWLQTQPRQAFNAPHTSTRDVEFHPPRPIAIAEPASGKRVSTKTRAWVMAGLGLMVAVGGMTLLPPPKVSPAPTEPAAVPPPLAAPQQAMPPPVVSANPPPSSPPRMVRKARAAPMGPPGWLTIGTKEGWADISVDGKRVGPTPVFRVELSPGPHVVEATRANGEKQRRRVDVTSQLETKVAF